MSKKIEDLLDECSRWESNNQVCYLDYDMAEIKIAELLKEVAIGFFKWNAKSVSGYINYIANAKDAKDDKEMYESLEKFENSTLEERYQLYLNHLQSIKQ